MQRFRLLGFYVAGLVALIGLTVGELSTRRAATNTGTPQARASDPGTRPTQNAELSPLRVSIDNFVFEPKELVIAAGTTVTWVNADDMPHTVTSTASPALFGSKTLDTDDKFSFEFKVPGTYTYFCKLHPYMTGKVVVK
jgi:plastocyanin